MDENNRNRRKTRAMMKTKRRKSVTIITLIVLIVLGTGVYVYAHHDKEDIQGKTASSSTSSSKPNPSEIMKGENIIYSANSYAVPANEVEKMLESKKPLSDKKKVFLTFDDGPSENTSNILKILKDEGVHATFFVIGYNLKNNPENQKLLKEEIESGNAIGNHSFSHDYHKLYPGNSVNVKVFMNEINKTDNEMKKALGENFNTRVLRMPGGYLSRKYYRDPHLKQLDEVFNKSGIVSIDWDAETGDAESNTYTVEHLVSRAKFYMKQEKEVILLMHDAAAKKSTVKALPQIIKMFKDNGYEFKVIENAPMSYFNNSNK